MIFATATQAEFYLPILKWFLIITAGTGGAIIVGSFLYLLAFFYWPTR